MGKINGCLKCLFVFFNVFFAIIGCVLMYGAVQATALAAQVSALGTPSLGWLWVIAIGTLGISCLGIFAGCSENSLALKIFAGFMAAGLVIMLIFGIVVVVQADKTRKLVESASAELATGFMESEEAKQHLSQIQQASHCCGVVSASDWGTVIPDSCACQDSTYNLWGSKDTCIARPQGTTGPDQIYQQACIGFVMVVYDLFSKIIMGICFGFAVTALLGLLVVLWMIHMVNRHDGTGGSLAMRGY